MQPKTYEAKDIIYPALIISVSFFFLSGSKALRFVYPNSVFGCKNFCSYGRIFNVLRWLEGNNQYRVCIGLLESIPDSVLWESELLGCTQRGKGWGILTFLISGDTGPFDGLFVLPVWVRHLTIWMIWLSTPQQMRLGELPEVSELQAVQGLRLCSFLRKFWNA